MDSAMVAPGCLEGEVTTTVSVRQQIRHAPEVPMPSLLRRLDLQALPEAAGMF